MNPSAEKFGRHVNPALVRLLGVLGYGRVFVRAQDVWVWDDQGRRYLDFLAGFGSVNIGHSHPRLIRRLQEFLGSEAMNVIQIGPSAHAADLAEALVSLARPFQIALFSNSGSEAVETGLKLARAATGRTEFVYCHGAFHGANLGALSVMGEERMRRPFEPLLEGCHGVPFGDLASLEKALAPRRTAGFVVEPIQGEGGVVLPPAGYLREAQGLCHRAGTLLILDEVQTGLGRTGTMFAYQAEECAPDVLVLAKSLGGSIAPIGATLTTRKIHQKAYGSMDRFDLNGATFAGNAFSCAAALETLRILAEENLVANSAARGKQLLQGLKNRLSGHPLVRDVRGRGLFAGIELGPTNSGWMSNLARPLVKKVSESIFGQWVALKMLENGIICQPSSHNWNVLRLEPPLTVRETEVEQVVGAVAEVLWEYESIAPLLKDATQRLGKQLAKGWAF